jgi:hypothetical protein
MLSIFNQGKASPEKKEEGLGGDMLSLGAFSNTYKEI